MPPKTVVQQFAQQVSSSFRAFLYFQ